MTLDEARCALSVTPLQFGNQEQIDALEFLRAVDELIQKILRCKRCGGSGRTNCFSRGYFCYCSRDYSFDISEAACFLIEQARGINRPSVFPLSVI